MGRSVVEQAAIVDVSHDNPKPGAPPVTMPSKAPPVTMPSQAPPVTMPSQAPPVTMPSIAEPVDGCGEGAMTVSLRARRLEPGRTSDER